MKSLIAKAKLVLEKGQNCNRIMDSMTDELTERNKANEAYYNQFLTANIKD